MQASELTKLSRKKIIKRIGPLFTEDQRKTGILASISLAQFIYESACGKSELAIQANNCFGMKAFVSNNDWPNSLWDGASIYTKKTKEYFDGVTPTIITDDFRKYKCVEDSIADHSAYLLGAKIDNRLRYEGIQGCVDYKTTAKILQRGGYSTGNTYGDSLCDLISEYDLTRYDI